MSRIGISLSIDVTQIDKARLVKGKKGIYLDLKTFIDIDKPNEHGNIGFVTQSITKEESDRGKQMPILGNVKLIWKEKE